MNKARAKKIEKLRSKIEGLVADVNGVLEAEQGYFDGLSEKAQEGDKGEQSANCISALEDAVNSLESAFESLEEAQGDIDLDD